MKADNRFTAEMIEKINAILESDIGDLAKWNKIVKIFKASKIAYTRKCKVGEVMVSKYNRDGLGLNAYNVHEVLATVLAIGTDLEHLHKATAFELSGVGALRDEEIKFNENLILNANGLLAELTGDERLCSVASSHFTASLRALIAGTRTSEESLKDSSGRLNRIQLTKNDEVMRQILDEGFIWTIIPVYAMVLFPGLPGLAQKALNAEHTTFNMATELQVMAGMALIAELEGGSPDWNTVVEKSKASRPPCTPYLKLLASFVKDYSGGIGAPIIKYLDSWAKTFGSNKKLGQVFLEAVINARFDSSATQFPLLRAACLAGNLVCPQAKVIDGYARLLTKSDIGSLAKRDSLLAAMAAEDMLSDAWTAIQQIIATGSMSDSKAYALFGKVSTRTVLYLVKKGKLGIEEKEFKNLKEIKAAFDNDIAGKEAPSENVASSSASSSASSQVAAQATLDDMQDPAYIAQSKGFAIGGLYICKDTKAVFKLDAFDHAGAKLTEQTLHGSPLKMNTKFADLQKSLQTFKGKLQLQIPDGCGEFFPKDHAALKLEFNKTAAFRALVETAQLHSDVEMASVRFFMQPNEIRCIADMKVKQLKLIPATDFSGLTTKSRTSKFAMVHKELGQFFIEAPTPPKSADKSEWTKGTIVSGFWWVKPTEDAEVANMTLAKMTVNGWSFPVYENSKAIKASDKLRVFVPPANPAKKART